MDAGSAYKDEFFDYLEEGSDRSARTIVPLVHRLLGSRSVLDVGCGRGVWLRRWAESGVGDIVGVDGEYVARRRLAIPPERFVSRDLSQRFDLDRCFDLVQSLEVAEHIDARHAETFVANLVRHGDIVLFSAAVPGQGGTMHVNEQPYDHWRRKFAAHGFRMFDWLRPRVAGSTAVEPWYRYNTFLLARDRAVAGLPQALVVTEIRPGQPIPDYAPLTWRLRNRLLRHMPQHLVHRMAALKHKLALLRRPAGPTDPAT